MCDFHGALGLPFLVNDEFGHALAVSASASGVAYQLRRTLPSKCQAADIVLRPREQQVGPGLSLFSLPKLCDQQPVTSS